MQNMKKNWKLWTDKVWQVVIVIICVFRDLSVLCECYVGCSVSTGMMLRHREETVYIIGIARLGKYILTLSSVQTSNTVLKCWTVTCMVQLVHRQNPVVHGQCLIFMLHEVLINLGVNLLVLREAAWWSVLILRYTAWLMARPWIQQHGVTYEGF